MHGEKVTRAKTLNGIKQEIKDLPTWEPNLTMKELVETFRYKRKEVGLNRQKSMVFNEENDELDHKDIDVQLEKDKINVMHSQMDLKTKGIFLHVVDDLTCQYEESLVAFCLEDCTYQS